MNGLKLIKEEIFPVKDKPWVRKFFSEMSDKCFRSFELGYAIYTEANGEIRPLRLRIGGPWRQPIGFKKSFVNHIKKHNPTNFKDTLFLMDIYRYFNRVDFEKAIKRFHHHRSTTFEVIDSILADSRGIILWHYQLENLLNMFIMDRNEVITIRKDINKKKADTFKLLKNYKIDDTLTLEDVISERMILTYVSRQNIYEASLLYDVLKL